MTGLEVGALVMLGLGLVSLAGFLWLLLHALPEEFSAGEKL